VSGFHIALVPVGKIDVEELRAAAARATKTLRQPVEVRTSVALPRSSEDSERGQHRAATLLGLLRISLLQTKPGEMIGNDDASAKPPHKPDGVIFVTDADLFTAKTDGVYAALISAKGTAVVSVRRLREAYYRRKADPTRQRARLVKEILRMAGRLRGASECGKPDCVLAASKSLKSLYDLDAKSESFCRACALRIFEGTMRV